jgi:hypothetical protein
MTVNKIPPFVSEYFRDEVKTKGGIVVDVDVFDKQEKFLYRHGLTFASDLHFHGANNFTLGINEYLNRLLTYSMKPIKIYINRKLLSDIKPLVPLPVHEPTIIDLSNVKESNN